MTSLIKTKNKYLDMFTWYLKALSRFAEFKGRSRRKEFFYFLLVDLIVSLVVVRIQGPMDFLSLGLFTSVYGIFWLITLRQHSYLQNKSKFLDFMTS